jgi:hypothetical protein
VSILLFLPCDNRFAPGSQSGREWTAFISGLSAKGMSELIHEHFQGWYPTAGKGAIGWHVDVSAEPGESGVSHLQTFTTR